MDKRTGRFAFGSSLMGRMILMVEVSVPKEPRGTFTIKWIPGTQSDANDVHASLGGRVPGGKWTCEG
jgi:hypothetical protein